MADSTGGTATVVFTVAYEVLVDADTDLLGKELRETVEFAVGPTVEGAVLLTAIRSGPVAVVVPTLPVAAIAGQGAPQPALFRTRWDLHRRP
jgi:hypothetical protein